MAGVLDGAALRLKTACGAAAGFGACANNRQRHNLHRALAAAHARTWRGAVAPVAGASGTGLPNAGTGSGSGTNTAMGATGAAGAGGAAAAMGLAAPPGARPDGRGAAGPDAPAPPVGFGALNCGRAGAARPEAPAAGACEHAQAQPRLQAHDDAHAAPLPAWS
jgi:hypothetical protein